MKNKEEPVLPITEQYDCLTLERKSRTGTGIIEKKAAQKLRSTFLLTFSLWWLFYIQAFGNRVQVERLAGRKR
jgi:hypothetical protein